MTVAAIDCPTPTKAKHYTKQQARSALARLRRLPPSRPGRLHVYRCDCGFFHVGHLRPDIARGERTRAQVFTRVPA